MDYSRVMDQKEVFGLALGLQGTPWYVAEIRFDAQTRRLDIDLDFPPGSRFAHPETQELCPVYDTQQRSWRHLNFFQFQCYVNAFVPRVDGGPRGGVKQVSVPWARPQSGFSLLMESLMVLLAQTGMTVKEIGETTGEYAQRIWTVLFHHVELAHDALELKGVKTLSVDEVSRRRGHNYLTVVSEPGHKSQLSRVLLVTEGKDASTLGVVREFLGAHGAPAAQIQNVCADMSPAYIKGIAEQFPAATLIFDFFHVIQAVSEALDEVRRRERKSFPELLKGTRWLFLKGADKLTAEELAQRDRLCRGKLQTGRAYGHLEALRDIMKQPEAAVAEKDLKWWCGWVARSRIPEMVAKARMIREHWEGIVAYLKTRITNGAAEALNGIIQTVKRKSRGFRTIEYFRTMIYLVASRLQFDLPSPVPVTHTKSY
jgi:transposase